MKNRILLLVFIAALVAGCGGGSTSSQNSALDVEMAILQVEGEFLIEGTVFNDLNGNGVMDTGEPGISSVTVSLVDLEDTLTDENGHYSFGVTTTGVYTVVETDPEGYTSTTPNEVELEVIDSDVTVDFGDESAITTYSIFGTVFDDDNGNGFMDSGESGITGVTVTLVGVDTAITDDEGDFAFAITVTGFYSVVETDPDGYVSTTPNQVDLEVIDTDIRVDFGDRSIQEVPVDVKPGSVPNPINLRSKGVLPVAILGSADLDISLIDPATILLQGVSPLRWNYEDVIGPDPETEEIPDGYEDLTLKFSTQEIAAAIGDVAKGDVVTLNLTGSLFDGAPIMGEELVLVVQIAK